MTVDPHTPTCAGFDPHPGPVTERLPRGSCDTHFHLFGPYQSYPLQPKRGYTPPEASLDDYRRMCAVTGIERAVLVQPSIYGADVSQLLDVLRSNRDWLCGIAVIDEDISDARLDELDQAGVRGFRLNYALGGGMPLDRAHALGARVKRLGWHVPMMFDLSTQPGFYQDWKDFPVPIVVDHMGQMPVRHGVQAPGFQGLLRLLREGRAYVKLSGVNRISAQPYPHEDVLPFVRALVAAHPQRLLWGSDWPHPLVQPTPNDGDIANLITRWLPGQALRELVLVSNPAALYGFNTP